MTDLGREAAQEDVCDVCKDFLPAKDLPDPADVSFSEDLTSANLADNASVTD